MAASTRHQVCTVSASGNLLRPILQGHHFIEYLITSILPSAIAARASQVGHFAARYEFPTPDNDLFVAERSDLYHGGARNLPGFPAQSWYIDMFGLYIPEEGFSHVAALPLCFSSTAKCWENV